MRQTASPLRGLSIFALLLVLGSVVPSVADSGDSPERRCRRAIATALGRWVQDTTRIHQRCLAGVVRGEFDASTDCVSSPVVQPSFLGAGADLRARVQAGCDGANWGLLSFPGPCGDDGLPFGSGHLSRCVESIGRDAMAQLLSVWSPSSIVDPRGRIGSCVQGIPKKAAAMLVRELRARLDCLLAWEASGGTSGIDCRAQFPPYDAGTGDAAIDRKIFRARGLWLGGIPSSCATTAFSALGYAEDCALPSSGAGLTDLQACVFAAHRQRLPLLLDLAFPSDPVCGNGILQDGEECDNGAGNSDTAADACRSDCREPMCGDRTTDPGYSESCDDGNFENLDGCTSACRLEFCGDGTVNNLPVESCDDGNTNPNDRCTNACRDAVCGDGVACTAAACTSGPNGGPELCDLGAQNSASGLCRPDCSGYRRTCTLTVGVTNNVRLGALTYELGYGEVAGDFLGAGAGVQCTSAFTGGLVSFFDNETKRTIKESLIVDAGLTAPAPIARCTWATNASSVSASAFPISVQVAANPDFDPVDANVAVTAVECQP